MTFQVFRSEPAASPEDLTIDNLGAPVSDVLTGMIRNGVAQVVWEPPEGFSITDFRTWMVPIPVREAHTKKQTSRIPLFVVRGGRRGGALASSWARAPTYSHPTRQCRTNQPPAGVLSGWTSSGSSIGVRPSTSANRLALRPLRDDEPRMVRVRFIDEFIEREGSGMTVEVPGIEHTFLVLETEDGIPYTKEYFRLDIGDMTPRTLLGDQWRLAGMHSPDDVKVDPDKQLSRVPIGNLTKWVLQEKQKYWEDPGRAADHGSKAREVMELILAEPVNDRFSAAVFWRGDAGGFIYPRMPEGHPDQGSPVFLFLPYGAVGVRELRDWYGQALTKSVKGVVEDQTKDLDKELGKAVKKLKKALADREKVRDRMLPLLQKFQMGPLVFDICDEFVMEPSVRKRRWGWKHAEEDWVIPKPGMARTKRAKDLRRAWEEQLIEPCAAVMSSTLSEMRIDDAAKEVLGELRTPGAPVRPTSACSTNGTICIRS